MNPTIKMCMVVLSTAGIAVACSKPEEAPPPNTAPAAMEAPDTTHSYAILEAHGEYRAKMEQQVNDLQKRVGDMLAKLPTPTDDVMRRKQDDLVVLRRDLRQAWDEFVNAPEGSFDSAKRKIGKIHDDAKMRVDAIADRDRAAPPPMPVP